MSFQGLLKHNAKVYIAGRSRAKYEQFLARLKTEANAREALFLEVDLGNLASVKLAAEEYLR